MRPRDRRTTEDRLERLLEVDPVAMGTAQAAAWAGTSPTLSGGKHGLGAELFDLIADLLFIGV